jgi:hypothetical protein
MVLPVLVAAVAALASEPRADDGLLEAARRALPQEFAPSQVSGGLQNGLWDSGRTAVAATFPRPSGTLVLVLLRKANGAFLAVDISNVERSNLGKLGLGGETNRVESTPVKVSRRANGSVEVVVRTRVWKRAQRYTVSEPVVVKPDGTVLLR